jgi:hypothetical protein
MSKFIWEVSELDATTRKADVAALKAFITKGTVTVRKAYGKRDTVKPALASMVGTVNDATGFLTDETGNRRFYAIHVTHIDWSYQHLDVDQVWAQAVALYRAGEPWRLLPEEAQRQTEQNRLFEAETPMEGWILKHFDLTGQPQDVLSAADIFDHLRSKGVQRQGTRGDAIELSAVLKRLGVEKDRLGKDRARVYLGIALRETPASLTPPDDRRTTLTNLDQPSEQGCPPVGHQVGHPDADAPDPLLAACAAVGVPGCCAATHSGRLPAAAVRRNWHVVATRRPAIRCSTACVALINATRCR